jgi:hypothetical protein
MKTKFNLLAYLLILISVISCGGKEGGFEVINNPKNPDVEQVQLDLIKSIELNDKIEELGSWIVADEKVYLCTNLQKYITIIDLDGNLIKKLDSAGKGPGEFLMPQVIINDERNSRIEVFDSMLRRYSYFTYEGEYIEDKMLPSTSMYIPVDRKLFGDSDVEYIFGMDIKPDKIMMSPTIQIVKPDTTIILVTRDLDLNLVQMDPYQFAYTFACSDEYVFVSPITTDKYRIDVFDANGKKVKEIRKQFSRIKRSEEEMARMKKEMAEYEKMLKEAGVDYDLSKFKYLEAISDMVVDSKGNLWVGTYDTDGKPYYDIVNPEGRIVKRCKKDMNSTGIKFYDNKLVEIIKNPNYTYTMNVYEVKW